MNKMNDKIIKLRRICLDCGYKSHWKTGIFNNLIQSINYCPKRECSASRELDYEIKKEKKL